MPPPPMVAPIRRCPVRPNAAASNGSYNLGRACREGWSAIDIGRAERLDMAASYTTPGPDESGGLSAREQKALAAIEHDLFVADPTLARHLECADWPRAGIRLRAAVRHVALLITALIILIIVATAVPADWWSALVLLTTLLLVPWILLFASDHPNQD
jgi:hypothetical protein